MQSKRRRIRKGSLLSAFEIEKQYGNAKAAKEDDPIFRSTVTSDTYVGKMIHRRAFLCTKFVKLGLGFPYVRITED